MTSKEFSMFAELLLTLLKKGEHEEVERILKKAIIEDDK